MIARRDFLVRAAAVTAALQASHTDQLLTQAEAAQLLRVTTRYLRSSDCPKVLLPGTGSRPLVRYSRRDVLAWVEHWTARRSPPSVPPASRPVARNASRP